MKRSVRPWSLHGRLLAVAAVSGALSWLAGGAAIYAVVQRQDAVLFDARLGDMASTLLAFADHEIEEVRAAGEPVPARVEIEGTVEGRYRYQIWSRDGHLVLSSGSAPTDGPMVPLGQPGWVTSQMGGERFRVVTIRAPSQRYTIQAAEPLALRVDLSDIFTGQLGIWLLLSALALAAWTLFLARLALRPLDLAAQQLGQRGPADLRAVVPERLPDEFAPLLDAINQLMGRVDVALRSEREFVSAAAHELRTPLAGLQAQAQLAAHRRTSPEDRQLALQAVQDGVDHAAHLVSQLLDLARSDALAGDPVRVSSDRQAVVLREVLEYVLGELGPQAAERGLRLTQRFDVATVSGSQFGIGLILRNLLANAVAHAPVGGEVQVGTRAEGSRVVLWVADSGPGVPAPERARMFERFYRGKGNEQPGCGLGLSIVKALADAHGALVTLGESPLGGLLAEVAFPAAPAA
jgi:signal transduction histidine kinase